MATNSKDMLTTHSLSKASARGKGSPKEAFNINCWPVGNGKTFITNAMEGVGVGFVVRAISQTLSIDARAAFTAGKDLKTWSPNADGTMASGDGYATLRRDLRKAGVPEEDIEPIVEMAKQKVAADIRHEQAKKEQASSS